MNKNFFKDSLMVLPFILLFFSACSAKVAENTEDANNVKDQSITAEVLQTSLVNPVDNGKDVKVKIKTTLGDITILLYGETPLHQKNFIKLVNEKFYDGILFHRVIKDFMIQAGDPDSKTAAKGQMLGSGGPGYTIPAEFRTDLFHKKGALSAARTGDQMNPEKKSSGSQFYIVQGTKYNDMQLTQMDAQLEAQSYMPLIRKYLSENPEEMKKVQDKQNAGDQAGLQAIIDEITKRLKAEHPEIKPLKLSEKQKEIYKTIGGTPHLDGNYTVFGEVIEGLEVIDKIAAFATDASDRPVEDVKIISMELIDK
ncbi:MAG: peptidylprolyl isomerase [Bacteroidales bacterium]|nr:peptidylprolyl isomerase [Bacteroidales bacterium]